MPIEEKLIIEPWDDGEGNSPIEDFLAELPAKSFRYIVRKREYYEKRTVQQLKNNRLFLEDIKGTDSKLWELKFRSSPQYRAVCIIRGNSIIMLVMFKGSGSEGEVMRHVPKALERSIAWDERYLSSNDQ